jgi:hypothetical protein
VPAQEPPERPLAEHQRGHHTQDHDHHDPGAEAGAAGRGRRRAGRGQVGQRRGADLDERRAGQRGRLVAADEAGHLEEAEARAVGERGGRDAGAAGEAVEAAGGDADEELLRGDLRRTRKTAAAFERKERRLLGER